MRKLCCAVKRTCAYLLSLFLAVVTFTACFSACGEAEVKQIVIKVPRSIMLNSVTRPDIKNMATLLTLAGEDFSARYGKSVKIRIVEFETDKENEAIFNTFGTSSAADILFDSFYNMSAFIHTGNAVPLDDVLGDGLRQDLNDKYIENGCFNGKLYMMPYMESQNILIYNKQLFSDCGLGEYVSDGWEISKWEIDDWVYILNTLAEKLPTNCVPTMMYAKDNEGDTHIMTLLRSHGSDLFDENNKFSLVGDAKAVDGLRWIQNGVTNGWYMSVPYYKTYSDNSSKFRAGEMAVFNFNSSDPLLGSIVTSGNEDKYGFVNYPGNKCTFFCEGFEVFDNGDPEKISIAKDFIKYFYGTDEWLECSAGSIPVSSKVIKKHSDKIPLLDALLQNAVNEVDFRRNLPNWQGASNSVRSVFYREIANLLITDAEGEFVYSAEDIAKRLQEKLNAAIESGWANSHPHD